MSSEYDPKSEPRPSWHKPPADPLRGIPLNEIFDEIDGIPSQKDGNSVVEQRQEPPTPEPPKLYERSSDWHAPLPDPLPRGRELNEIIDELFRPTKLRRGFHLLRGVARQVAAALREKRGESDRAPIPSRKELQHGLDQVALSAVRLEIMQRNLSAGESALDVHAWELLADHHGTWGMIMVLSQLLHLESDIEANTEGVSVHFVKALESLPNHFETYAHLRPFEKRSKTKPVLLTVIHRDGGFEIVAESNASLTQYPKWRKWILRSKETPIPLSVQFSFDIDYILEPFVPDGEEMEINREKKVRLDASLRFYDPNFTEPPLISEWIEERFNGELTATTIVQLLKTVQLLVPTLTKP